MIHYFNPGHETAVLNASKHYHQPANVAKMQADLAFLPAWYASEGDCVYTDAVIAGLTRNPIENELLIIRGLRVKPAMTNHSAVDLWGISPQSIHFFEKINEQYNLCLKIPQWKDEYKFLGSRFASQKILSQLIERIPEIEKNILPQFFSDIESIEQQIIHSKEKLLIKSPYSSSGRGLIWLPYKELAQSEKQILTGMLKKQKQVSIEKALDKVLDFSLQFEITDNREIKFIGYSVFQTNSKGAYERSLLDTQNNLKKQITAFINPDLLLRTKSTLTEILQEMYAPYYAGIIGVDMLIYRSDDFFRLYPCVEINMRKNMGYLAVRFAENYLHPESKGSFHIEFNSDSEKTVQNHIQWQNKYPLTIEEGRIIKGYLSLCPVTEDTNYHAYILVS